MLLSFHRFPNSLLYKVLEKHKMYTSLGRFLKKLRLENEEHLYDMAVKLKVSSAFLSKVENGKSKPPTKWESIIENEYKLTDDQKVDLCRCIQEARNNTTINVKELSIEDRDLVRKLAGKLNAMDVEHKNKFKEFLDSF